MIELAFFIGLTHQEISDRTELALGTVKSRIRLGMEKLAPPAARGGLSIDIDTEVLTQTWIEALSVSANLC